jgi:amidase
MPDTNKDSTAPADASRRSFLELSAVAAIANALPRSASATSSDIVNLEGTALASAIRERKLSCAEAMTAHLDQIERLNPKVNAIVALQSRDGLLAQARERDAQLASGTIVGPLHGIPMALKDLRSVRGIVSTEGSPIFKDFVPTEDSLMVARLRAAGAIFIGKTNMPEFGLGSHTYNPVYGATHNAFDLGRSAGGSSGGAAVALALRMVPFADGSDAGGSLRNPAGWNNVFGFRTSIGRIPTDAADGWLPSMAVVGPMARSVQDLATLLAVQAGFDPRVPLSLGDSLDLHREIKGSVKGKRVAFGGDLGGSTPCEPEVLSICRSSLKTFESLGCEVAEDHPKFDFDSLWQAVIQIRAWQIVPALLPHYKDPQRRPLIKDEALYEIETSMKLSASDISAASTLRTRWYLTVVKFFEKYDFLVLPTAQLFPFPIEWHWPQSIANQKMQTYHEWIKMQLFVSMAGCPALAAPAGFSATGLPMGIQIIAPNRRELDCLQLAAAYESATEAMRKHKPALLAR